jgi:hypothetical protein
MSIWNTLSDKTPVTAKRAPFIAMLLLSGLAAVVPGTTNAQAHGVLVKGLPDAAVVDPDAPRAQKAAELEAWLRRLVGRFRYEGSITNSVDQANLSVSGLIDCRGVGDGPGVQCVINVDWSQHLGKPVWALFMAPSMTLFGLDPGAMGIQYLRVDGKGIGEAALGSLKGDTVSFTVHCVNVSEGTCKRRTRISAPEDSSSVWIYIDTEISSMTVLYRWRLKRLPKELQDSR